MPARLEVVDKRQALGGVTNQIGSGASSATHAAKNATKSLSRPEVIGLAVGLVAIVAVLIFAMWWCCTKTARKDEKLARDEASRRRFLQLPATSSNPSASDENGVVIDQHKEGIMSQVNGTPMAYNRQRNHSEEAYQMPTPNSFEDEFEAAERRGSHSVLPLQQTADVYPSTGTDGFGWGAQQYPPHAAVPANLEQVYVPSQHRQAPPPVPQASTVYLEHA